MKVAVLIPTLNAGKKWLSLLNSIQEQSITVSKKIIIDSGSNDDTIIWAKKYNFDIINLKKEQFDHGYARQLLAEAAIDTDVLIYLTQDCILANKDALRNLSQVFNDQEIGLSYGRQLPHKDAKTLESHARLFNYPEKSQLRSFSEVKQYGFKTIFCSNSFAAYRTKAFFEVGGFPVNNIMGEDTLVAAKLIERNWKIAYLADAEAFHSHSYTLIQEFKRYFDTGVFHAQNLVLYDKFGKPTGEGFRYVLSELKYSYKRSIWAMISVVPKTAVKFLGFKLGLIYKSLPFKWIKLFSMHTIYWDKNSENT